MSPIETTVRMIVDLLVRGEFAGVERVTGGSRLSAETLRTAVAEHGRTLSPPGERWWSTVTIMPVSHEGGRRLHVAAPLWTVEEGRSDLTLELELDEIGRELFKPAVLGLHVL